MKYYYIIPAELAEEGKPFKALLYGLIQSLCYKNGKCTASNKYLANKLNRKDKSIISDYIRELRQEGWINITVENSTKRIITLRKNPKGVSEKTTTPLRKNPKIVLEDSIISSKDFLNKKYPLWKTNPVNYTGPFP